jgi:hypothetical protein
MNVYERIANTIQYVDPGNTLPPGTPAVHIARALEDAGMLVTEPTGERFQLVSVLQYEFSSTELMDFVVEAETELRRNSSNWQRLRRAALEAGAA